MRTRTFATLFALASVLGIPACDKKEEKKEDKKSEAKKDEKKADAKTDVKADVKADAKLEPAGDVEAEGGDVKAEGGEPAAAAGGTVELTKLGLKAEAPAGTSIGDALLDEEGAVMVQGPGFAATVEAASDTTPKTEEEAKKEADQYKPKNVKSEKLADGFAVTFDNEGELGANFFVQVRRDIGGKSYWCSSTTPTVEQRTTALDFCKSLKQ